MFLIILILITKVKLFIYFFCFNFISLLFFFKLYKSQLLKTKKKLAEK